MASKILNRIVAGTYPPGLRIPAESELATELGCGRSTIREALRHLAGLGVVRSRQGSGAVVLDYRTNGCSMELLVPWLMSGKFEQPVGVVARELLRTRTYLACEGARLAASYAKPGALELARSLVNKSCELEGDAAAHAMNDVELHRAINAASGILPAVWMSNALHEPFAELGAQFPPVALVPHGYANVMHTLLDLIEAGDADGAVAHLRQHLAKVDQVILDRLGASAP